MSSSTVQIITGTYRAQAPPSSFVFGVRHSEVFWFRGSLGDVEATLRGDANGLALEGSARVDSISVLEPPQLRAHLLGPDFFDAEQHPEITFRSSSLCMTADQGARLQGELTMRGVSRPVGAVGQYAGPRASSFGELVGLELHTSVDRREFGFNWQMPLSGGGDALGWEVEIDLDLLLIREAEPE
ncbi:MAG TPA: YceI family protein [Solirubrobacteraceae bacterium]|nr:YceI family protein [Solirubrobacteraceae bacterium]